MTPAAGGHETNSYSSPGYQQPPSPEDTFTGVIRTYKIN